MRRSRWLQVSPLCTSRCPKNNTLFCVPRAVVHVASWKSVHRKTYQSRERIELSPDNCLCVQVSKLTTPCSIETRNQYSHWLIDIQPLHLSAIYLCRFWVNLLFSQWFFLVLQQLWIKGLCFWFMIGTTET